MFECTLTTGRSIVMLLAFLLCGHINAQPAASDSPEKAAAARIESAAKLYKDKKYASVILQLTPLIAGNQASDKALYYAALAHLQLNHPEVAYDYLSHVDPTKAIFLDDFHFWKAKAAYQINLFDSAQVFMNRYLGEGSFNRKSSREVQSLRTALANVETLSLAPSRFSIEPMPEGINTPLAELALATSPDQQRLFFNRKAPQDQKGAEELLSITNNKDDNWSKPLKLNYKNTATSLPLVVQLLEGQHTALVYEAGELNIAELSNGLWQTKGKADDIINTEKDDRHAHFFDHGNKVVFATQGGNGSLDLFFSSRKRDGTWQFPVPLTPLNTPQDETTPFVSEDGKTLYFSSQGHNSIGGHDVFKATFNPKTQQWERPFNLGIPLNSSGNDYGFCLFNDQGFLISDRAGGKGAEDIYRVYAFTSIALSGQVRQEQTGAPIAACRLKLFGEQRLVAETLSDAKGYYTVQVPFNQALTARLYQGPDLLWEGPVKLPPQVRRTRNATQHFAIRATAAATPADSEATMTHLSGKVSDAANGKPIKAFVKLLNAQTGRTIKITSADASGNYNFYLDQAWSILKIEARARGYIVQTRTIGKEQWNQGKGELNLPLAAIAPGAVFHLDKINFEPNAPQVRPGSEKDLERLYDFLSENSELKVEIGLSPESNASAELSEKRAAWIKKYLENKGIAAQRLLVKGTAAQAGKHGENVQIKIVQ